MVPPSLREEVVAGVGLIAVVEILFRLGLAAERLAVLDLLDVLESAGYPRFPLLLNA
jgi:hypothetical protein